MSSKNGLTLIELIVALTLFSVGMTAIIYMLNTAMFADSDMEQSLIAMNLANERMEEIRNTAFASISSGTETGSSIGFSQFDNRVTTVTNTASDLKNVLVEVQWTQKGGQQSVGAQTYIADN